MPFAIEVAQLDAPTEIYELLGEDTPEKYKRTTEVFVVVSVYRNVINWFVMGQMNLDSQKFRDEIYACAGRAHNTLERGCGAYYRGTNSVHVKRHHADAFEAMYNHNHYPLGGEGGADFDPAAFPDPVKPEEFRQHLMAFADEDAKMHGGTPRFLTVEKAARIADEFERNYRHEIATQAPLDPLHREYTPEDIEELRLYAHQEQPCKVEIVNTRGIDTFRADQRQPVEMLDPDNVHYRYVVESREFGKKLDAKARKLEERKRQQEAIKREQEERKARKEAKKAEKRRQTLLTSYPELESPIRAAFQRQPEHDSQLLRDHSELRDSVEEASSSLRRGTAAEIASSAFTGEAVSATIEVAVKNNDQLRLSQNDNPELEVEALGRKYSHHTKAKSKQKENRKPTAM